MPRREVLVFLAVMLGQDRSHALQIRLQATTWVQHLAQALKPPHIGPQAVWKW
jgi:hypothetical protein